MVVSCNSQWKTLVLGSWHLISKIAGWASASAHHLDTDGKAKTFSNDTYLHKGDK